LGGGGHTKNKKHKGKHEKNCGRNRLGRRGRAGQQRERLGSHGKRGKKKVSQFVGERMLGGNRELSEPGPLVVEELISKMVQKKETWTV